MLEVLDALRWEETLGIKCFMREIRRKWVQEFVVCVIIMIALEM